jgi:hypothetical protein
LDSTPPIPKTQGIVFRKHPRKPKQCSQKNPKTLPSTITQNNIQKTSWKTITQCNVPKKPPNSKPSLDNIVKNPTLIFQQPKPSTSSWNLEFYHLSTFSPNPLLCKYYNKQIHSCITKKFINSLNDYKNYQKR